MNTQIKIGLSVIETGWLLQKTEAQVRGMLRRGELSYAVDRRLVSVSDVEALVGSGLAFACLRWLRYGRISAPTPERRWSSPASLFDGLDALLLASPALVVDVRTGESRVVPELQAAGEATEDGKQISLKPMTSFVQ
jgi:hypothetical protein